MNQIINELRAAHAAALHLGDAMEDNYAWGYASGIQAAIDRIDAAETAERSRDHFRLKINPAGKCTEGLREIVDRINKKNAEDTTVFPDNRDPAPSRWQDEARLGAAMAHGY